MNALEINNLSKVYEGGVRALDGIDLIVEEGDFFALLGPNGAGKTTTIGIICSLVNKSSGSVQIFDADIDRNLVKAKKYLGVVPQEFNFNIFETVEQIVINQAGFYGIGRKDAILRSEKFLKQLGLWEKRKVQARTLSGGMKRRLMIARSLVHEPRMLILDEPTAGVDIELRRSMWEFLVEINTNGTTIILTTHYLEEAELLCRHIAIIDRGRIVQNTSKKDLLAQLDTETIILELQSALTEVPTLNGYEVRISEPGTLEVDITRGSSLNGLFKQLEDRSIEVLSMRNKSNRLEELFIKMTGHKESIKTD